ncbi:MAG: DEAD/DEAH box helicase family protein [Clostridia bacterium]|nr:DEAD/DEAH box helicase family protein [Clostridia bacterium]
MCGFPSFRLEENVNALTEKGFDVILVDGDRTQHRVLSRDKALGIPEKKETPLAEQLVDFIHEYDFYEYMDNLNPGDTHEDAVREMEQALAKPENVRAIINDLNEYAEQMVDDNEGIAFKDSLIIQLEKLLPKQTARENAEDKPWDDETVMRVAKEEWEKATKPPQTALTYEQRNYNFINGFAPRVLEGNVIYALYESKNFMPIHINKLSANTMSISHTYEQNGDLMYDPEMVFEIDFENKALKPLEYRQDNMGIHQIAGENAAAQELSSFARQWFDNVGNQGFHLSKETLEYNGGDITVFYDENGKISDVKGEENAVNSYLEANGIELTGRETENLIGKELEIEDRKYAVESVNDEAGTVRLKDITFETGTGFPVFRRETVDFVKAALSQAEQTERIVPEFEKAKPSKVANTVIYPEIPMTQRNNFVIDNDELGVGGPKEKFRRNMEAIRVLKTCEAEHRLATEDEQKVLSEYVGWGGLPDAFDETKENWASEYQVLKAALTAEEYDAARASTLTAHFTSPVIIKAMYKAIENMGFSQGNILEPSCGIGNFMGLVPESMKDSKIYGIEIDSITGRIAQQLYQKNSVAVEGFEDTMLPDSFFDVAVGNVPFGDFKLSDKKYNKHNFLIHDYFFAKTLDKVRPGGIVAFITSSGTMDKHNSKVRRYIAQRADLVGAIRLPNNAFLKNAGTEVTSDILFLQKRDRMTDIMPDWVELGELENGITVNNYFVNNPDMILGEMKMVSGPFGPTPTCAPYDDVPLSEQLNEAIQNIHATITEYEVEDISNDEDLSLPADPNVRNFSYTLVNGEIYFRENSIMRKVDLNTTAQNRIKGMIEIRDCVRELMEYQTEGYADASIKNQQEKLNKLYDDFTKKYGIINSRGNSMAFSDDSSYFLLCSLEVLDENGELERKADMFSKRTIGAKREITKVDTASEALAVSLGEKAKIDMEFMAELTGKTEDKLYEDLKSVIFLNPLYEEGNIYQPKYLPADEYLSGDVRHKLAVAKQAGESNDAFKVNIEALTAVQPKDLSASEITVKLGSTWIPTADIKEFVFELLSPGWYAREKIDVNYSNITGEWSISNKSYDKGIKATNTFGTDRINAYKIIEESLNLRDVRIFDYVEDAEGRRKPVLNKKATMIAQQKQDLIKAEFENWIWKDPDRRERLTELYNIKFNSNRPREYDGSHITFSGMNPEIVLRKHQKDAVARVMYGGNTLLGHVVGAGKTWTMVAAAMEMKRLGLCNKSLFVVPNHLTEQWAAEFLQLYPAANILVATKKDFTSKNRKKFCGRIATGDYDAIIIGHSQFEKIPMSYERQVAILEKQKDEIMNGIIEAKEQKQERFTIKQLEKSKRGIETKLAKLNDQTRKDDVVTFEELGVDRIFIDEAHYYKNLFLYTKMRNVGGISQTEAQKSSDLFMKTQYLDEITDSKGVIFATGTPISNSMVELYTMQRYLQYKVLEEQNLQHFDAWASTFGETVTAIELAPEGTGYRAKTRFARFFNLPELMSMFKNVADIQTADMLNLPTPTPHYKTIAVEPTEIQKDMVKELAERAERVRNRMVDPTVDNMLKITNDGRKLALDQRLINPMLPDEEGSKVSTCAKEVFDIWEQTNDIRGTQLVFCDLSTPKNDDTFNVYTDIKNKLMSYGVPENEIEFIHNADTEVKKKELFSKVRKGDIRILLGSTPKMGAGTNVQRLLYASHDIDCPWRPADLEQRAGRIIRQGNTNPDVHIRRYVTKDTFDSYMWQLVENKQKFIGQIMTSKSPVRSAEDVDETALSYAEVKALATGNPYIKEKMDLDTQVAKLKLIKSSFMSQKYSLEDKIIKQYPREIASLTERIKGFEGDIIIAQKYPKKEDVFYPMTIEGMPYTDKEQAGLALLERCKKMTSPDPTEIGNYRGFSMDLSFDTANKVFYVTLKGNLSHKLELGTDVYGNLQRIDNTIEGLVKKIEIVKENLKETKKQFETAKTEVQKEFPQEAELQEKIKRLAEVDALLDMDKKEHEGADLGDDSDTEEIPLKKAVGLER